MHESSCTALQNRATPFGEIVAATARGLFMGNRGILHDENRRLGAVRWRHPHWIVCRLAFRGRRRTVMTPGRYTELFFLDEATALAAGHRPCAECRRDAWRSFQQAWQDAFQSDARPSAGELDRVLHRARVEPRSRRQITHQALLKDLPDGAFIDVAGQPYLVLEGRLLPWRPEGYGFALPRRDDRMVTVLSPRPTVAVMAAGYRPVVHPSAGS